jgi:hypothetical protein
MLNGVSSAVYTQATTVTPSDASANAFVAFMVSVGGTVTFRARESSADAVITAVAGFLYPIQTSFIRATGTAATGIVGLN